VSAIAATPVSLPAGTVAGSSATTGEVWSTFAAGGGHWSAEPRRYPRRGLGSDVDLDDEDDAAILTLLALT
jgi:hypothetical protein